MDGILRKLEEVFQKKISRRFFLKVIFSSLLAFFAESRFLKAAFAKVPQSSGRRGSDIATPYDLVEVEGPDPYTNTVKAVEAMGGISRFVKKDAKVVIKPNMSWARPPPQAATTEPDVVRALVDLCFKAGARRVNVFDRTCNDQRRCYERSGIAAAARESGANVYFPSTWNVVKAKFPYESPMEDWPVFRDAVECDTFINVPILKSHGLTRLTLSMKNLMGLCGGTRGLIHMNIGRKLVDLTDFIKPDLNVMDATRVLVRNGPSGGDLDDVIAVNKVMISRDATLMDAYSARLMNMPPESIPYIKVAMERGFGNSDVAGAKIHKLKA